jgi:hypothetical protein
MHPLDEPIFPGDIIGGPLAQLFGLGVQDVELRGCSGHPMCSHVKYWAEEEESAAKALRDALNLGDKEQ